MKFEFVDRTLRDGSSSVADEAKAALLADNTLFVADADLAVAPNTLRVQAAAFAALNGKILKFRRESIGGREGTIIWLEDPAA